MHFLAFFLLLLPSMTALASRGLAAEVDPMARVAATQAVGQQAESVVAAVTSPSGISPSPGEGFVEPVTGMDFVWVPDGCYRMGDSLGGGDLDEKPVHEVCVDGFWLGRYEVTVEQWQFFVKELEKQRKAALMERETRVKGKAISELKMEGDTFWRGDGKNFWKCKDLGEPEFEQGPDHPLVCVSWKEGQAFIEWLNKKSGLRFRMPTGAEWE